MDPSNELRYLVIHRQWIRGSDRNGEHVVFRCNRIKEARGMAKTHFVSHMDMMTRHEYLKYWDDYEISEEQLWIACADRQGLCYYVGYEVVDGLHFTRLVPD